MPELPEVQTTVDGLSKYSINKKIINAKFYRDKIRYPLNSNWQSDITSQHIINIYRRAKLIVMQLDDCYLLWHLGMSASMRICPSNEELRKHDHIELFLDNDTSIRFHDPRRFGYMKLFANLAELKQSISHYGIEPLSDDFTGDYLHSLSRKKTGAIKNFIMNQENVVGVGNIYACESLFIAKINPKKPAKSLTKKQAKSLVKNIKDILKKSIAAGGTTLKDFENADAKPGYFQQTLMVYNQLDKPCIFCKTAISQQKIAGRNTFYCKKCQK